MSTIKCLVLFSNISDDFDIYGIEKCVDILNRHVLISAKKLHINNIHTLSRKHTDILIIAGGEPRQIRIQLGGIGSSAIRKFIHDGGGYIGICAGAVLAIPKSPSLDLLQYVKTVNDNIWWESGVCGDIKLKTEIQPTCLEIESMCNRFVCNNSFSYKNGPLFKIKFPKHKTDNIPIPLAFFDGPLYNTHNDFSEKMMEEINNSTAIILGIYGKGSVLISSIHPEYDTDFSNSELLHEMCFAVVEK